MLKQQLHDRVKRLQFDTRFWPMVSNKVCKQDARDAWCKVMDTQEDIDLCLKNHPAWEKEWASWRPDRTRPYPATYLNRRQWEDPPPWAQQPERPEPQPLSREEKLETIENAKRVGMGHLVEHYRDDPDERVREALADVSDGLGV